MPVVVTAPDPWREAKGRRPVVAVLDTGVGRHPWFDHGVDRAVGFLGTVLGGPDVDADTAGHLDDVLLGTTKGQIGHGTFIAGLIRQGCPTANIISAPVIDGHGVGDEGLILQTLALLLLRHAAAIQAKETDGLIDVVSLSFGYYHETEADALVDGVLRPVLDELANAGVCVVAAAGNDSTTARLLPAGFAGTTSALLAHGAPQLVSVGALNPGAGTKALFSNDGEWVLAHRPGAALVSTLPTDLRGFVQSQFATAGLAAPTRSTVDLDDFRSGFGVWSGTSFAAPVLAAEVAGGLAGRTGHDVTPAEVVTRVITPRRPRKVG